MIDLRSAQQLADQVAPGEPQRWSGLDEFFDPADSKLILNSNEIEQFITRGFIRIDNAFSSEIADQVRPILWRDCGCLPEDPSTWKKPLIRLRRYRTGPFIEAANTKKLYSVFDQLVGVRGWFPCRSMGMFPIRFPSDEDPGDTDWHIDGSFELHEPDYLSWRVNFRSKTRALLMLFLFSDVGPDDAPTLISVGSHMGIARLLHDKGEWGLSLREITASAACGPQDRPIVEATGKAGTVYLCHPFLVHASQKHRGKTPRFMAQPRLIPRKDLMIPGGEARYSPVEIAISRAVANQDRLEAV